MTHVAGSGGKNMARPIEATPVLKGRDAERFLDSVRPEPISEDRQRWMQELMEQSRKAERPLQRLGSRVVSDPPFMASIFNDFAVQLSHTINDMIVQELNKRMVAKKPGPQRRQSKPKKDRRERQPPKAYTKAWWKSKAHVSTL